MIWYRYSTQLIMQLRTTTKYLISPCTLCFNELPSGPMKTVPKHVSFSIVLHTKTKLIVTCHKAISFAYVS